MTISNYKTDIICKLEKEIKNGKRIIIINHQVDREFRDLIKRIKSDLNLEVWCCNNGAKIDNACKSLSRKEIDEIISVHRIYDFSDKIIFISDSTQYGTLFNYVKTGILTEQEMVDALLYQI